MDGARDRIERERNLMISGAWLGERLARAKKVPKLEDLTRSNSVPKDPEFLLASLRARLPAITMKDWAARF